MRTWIVPASFRYPDLKQAGEKHSIHNPDSDHDRDHEPDHDSAPVPDRDTDLDRDLDLDRVCILKFIYTLGLFAT